MNDSDWISAERDHEYKMASLKEGENRRRREALTERISTITLGTVIVLGIGIVAALIFFWQKDSGDRGQQIELACVQGGGTWTTIGGGSSVCVRIAGADEATRG